MWDAGLQVEAWCAVLPANLEQCLFMHSRQPTTNLFQRFLLLQVIRLNHPEWGSGTMAWRSLTLAHVP